LQRASTGRKIPQNDRQSGECRIRRVSRELGVRYILEGSVRKGGDQLRVSAQVVEAATGNHLWAERYDRKLADIFSVQDEITERVVAAIVPELYAAEFEVNGL
jgi:adenylate cyclase